MFVNGEWMDIVIDCKVKFLPEGVSDYSPIQIIIAQNNIQAKKIFRYCNMWKLWKMYGLRVLGV